MMFPKKRSVTTPLDESILVQMRHGRQSDQTEMKDITEGK